MRCRISSNDIALVLSADAVSGVTTTACCIPGNDQHGPVLKRWLLNVL